MKSITGPTVILNTNPIASSTPSIGFKAFETASSGPRRNANEDEMESNASRTLNTGTKLALGVALSSACVFLLYLHRHH